MAAIKGLGAFQFPISKAAECGASWAYNWSPYDNKSAGSSVEFVPMIWGWKHDSDDAYAAAKACASLHLLGFNEPDGSDQANMSPEDCVKLWPKLIATGKRLVSPAVARDYGWLDRFLAGLDARGIPRPSAMAFHHYPDKMSDVEGFLGLVRWCYDRYHMPIWITEFGAIGSQDQAGINDFIVKVMPKLRQLDYVRRIAWFCDAPYGGYHSTNIFDGGGRLTDTGRAYKEA